MSAVSKARAHLDQAERALDESRAARDRAFASFEAAWRTSVGAGPPVISAPGATPLYSHAGFPDALLDAAQIITLLEQQRRALA